MASRARGYRQDWEREDFDETYEAQYPDDESHGGVQLDHCKLYITNINRALNEEGLVTAFSKYGTLVKVHVSRDPVKRYALITFETPGEAKLAMMKLNKTEPLKLNIHIAHKKNSQDQKEDGKKFRHRESNSYRDDASISSKGRRKQDDFTNGDNIDIEEELCDEDLGLDTDLELEMTQLKMKQLQLQQAQLQCKQQMLLLNRGGKKASQKTSRCILPDGRIVVRNNSDKTDPPDNTYSSAAGDSRALNSCSCERWNEQETSGTSTPSTCVLCSEDPSTKDKYTNKSKVETDQESFKYKSDVTKSRSNLSSKAVARKSEMTCDYKYNDFYSDSDEDETNRLIELRNSDYNDIVEDKFKIAIALMGYPKMKMRLKQMEVFQKSLNDIIDMQFKAGLLKKTPVFIDYYLNRGAIVCICKDIESRDWMVRIMPGMQERMSNNLKYFKAKLKRLCLALIRIPKPCWPACAQDAFKLLQYFNPTLKTHLWKIYAQKCVDDVEITSFLVDRVSGEIIRGPNFKNVIDYSQMEFELSGYTEIYYESFLSESDEDLSSVASRVKLLDELRSNDTTPRIKSENDDRKLKEIDFEDEMERKTYEVEVQEESVENVKDEEIINENKGEDNSKEHDIEVNESEGVEITELSSSAIAVSEVTESLIESSENLVIGRGSNLNIDSNRGIAYHRRTNYLHVENELKLAVVLDGYPQNKLEGTHIRRLKHLFKELLHKDMKMQKFNNLIIPKFQDIYLSNGAVIYICDSLETKDYLTEILPKFVNSTGLKLTFRDVKNLVRYTRVVMRLPKEMSNVESRDILLQLKDKYPNLRPDCWKYYSDVAGKQKRQFGVEPESLEVIKSPDFDPAYEGEKLNFRVIDRQKRDVSFEETQVFDVNDKDNEEIRKVKENILKSMYTLLEPEVMNAQLTKIRANHYCDLIEDDLKLYVGPVNYPETRIDECLFHTIKKIIENIVFETHGINGNEFIPTIHDMYLFDGVIFIICQNIPSRIWIEKNMTNINSKLEFDLKATEFRGAVGIVSMAVKTDKNTDDVINILQKLNPRLRTKFWRKISTARSRMKLDVVLQIDKLSAQLISREGFNNLIGDSVVQFQLGHLKSLIKPKSQPGLSRILTKNVPSFTKPPKEESKVPEIVLNKADSNEYNFQIEEKESVISEVDTDQDKIKEFKLNAGESKIFFYTGMETKSINNSPKRMQMETDQNYIKMVLKVPTNILPDCKDGLDIIFDLLEDKNPGLNTELWVVEKQSQFNRGKYQLTLPSLQRVSTRACLTCGAVADFYCGSCSLAQYCSQKCQQTDWNARHKFVCHNLACLNGSEVTYKESPVEVVETVISPPTGLRQPNLLQKKDYKQDDNKPNKNFTSSNKFRRPNPNLKNKTFRHPMKREKEKDDTDSFDRIVPGRKSIQKEEQEPEKPKENKPEPKPETSSNIKADIRPKGHNVPLKPPGSVLDTTPKSKAIVPKNYIIETLSLGDTVLLSVDALATECRSDSGYICLALHETNEADYQLLCGDFGEECEKEKEIDPKPGDVYALFVGEEAAWYRARRVSRSHAALLDCSRIIDLAAAGRSVALPARYEHVAECCCRLLADVKLNDNLKCTLVSKTSDGYKVSLENAETGISLGEGEVSRWKPIIEYGVSKPVVNVSIPEVPRPPLTDNSTVVIVDATAADKVYVRSAALADTKMFATVLQDGILVGIKGEPVSEPPQSGQTVVARHTDGNCYRALCTRTNVKQNKYLLEYIEYGNTDISPKEKIYPCPRDLDLSNKPTTVSLVKLNIDMAMNKNGLEYLEQLRDGDVELVLHTTDKSKSTPSGSSVELTVLQSKVSVIEKLKKLCSPEWKKIEEKGGDVVDCEPLMYGTLQYHSLPTTKCTLTVLDISTLRGGALGVCDVTLRHDALLEDITQQIEAYVKSDLGKEPYLPRIEELCIAQCPPYTQYYRAVLCDHAPGSKEATVCFVDYNNVETVSVATIRRMMPEFTTTPALACHAEIRGFPENPSDEQLARAVQHMKINDEGRGELSVERCEGVDPGFYVLHAPGLLAALGPDH